MNIQKSIFLTCVLFLSLFSSFSTSAQAELKIMELTPDNIDSVYQVIRAEKQCMVDLGGGGNNDVDELYLFLAHQIGIKFTPSHQAEAPSTTLQSDAVRFECKRLIPTPLALPGNRIIKFSWDPYETQQARYEMRSYVCRDDSVTKVSTDADSLLFAFGGETTVLSFVGFCRPKAKHSSPTIIIADKELFSFEADPPSEKRRGNSSTQLASQQLRISPNPFTSNTLLEWSGLISESVEINLYNPQGHLVNQWNTDAYAGKNSFNIDTNNLPAGCYIVQVRGSESQLQQLICKTQ